MKYLTFKFSFISFISIILICPGTSWSYSQCYDYLDNLNIICHKYYKDKNGIEKCQIWEVKNKSYIKILPNNCFNKEYNLELYINNSNPYLKKKLILFLDFMENINFLDKNVYLQKENKLTNSNSSNIINNIKQCLSAYLKYEIVCKENDIFYEKDEELCNELKIKKSNKFCMDLINRFGRNINSKIKKDEDIDNIEINLGDDNNYYLIFKEQNDNYDDKVDDNDEINNENKKNDYDKELETEMYYNRSRKDCVEYGLKENYIFCTKYE